MDERLCLATDKDKGINVVRRTAENSAHYAEAVRQVGKELNLPVLDLWAAFMREAGWKEGEPLPGSREIEQNQVLVKFMHDGLHFNPEGYKVLYDELMKLLEKEMPEEMPAQLPTVLPPWDQADAWVE